jgi:ABC-2 type transport system permease protein
MTALAVQPHPAETSTTPAPRRTAHRALPMTSLIALELRKMFNTRSGFWLMASIAISAVLATTAVILFAPDAELDYESFGAAVGFPMAVILPIVAILSVTSEWSQRSGLTTFTLFPRRGRVIAAKAAAAVTVGAVSIPLAFAIGAVGNVVGTTITGTPLIWNMSFTDGVYIVLGNVLGLLVGFMLGVLIRSSAGAIVGYFVYSLVLPTLFALLATSQSWFRDLQPWVDFNFAQGVLFEGGPVGEQWAQLGTAGLIWLVVPLAVGLALVMRSEVK